MDSVHEGQKPFEAQDIFKIKTESDDEIETHVATVDEGQKSYKCDICDKSFSQKCDLNTHVTTVHKNEVFSLSG